MVGIIIGTSGQMVRQSAGNETEPKLQHIIVHA